MTDRNYSWRRYIARWRHLDGVLEEGERLRRRTAKLAQDLRRAVPPPPRHPLSLAPRYIEGRRT